MCDRGSLVVKVKESWLVCHEFEPSDAEDPPCRGDPYPLDLKFKVLPLVGCGTCDALHLRVEIDDPASEVPVQKIG
ncbi:hypothetical protein TNCV_1295121 [Trichonephila clavipes]|nr:hypothetical protein TNCV_1295121 [Trichonephila clavipes]